MRGQSDEQGHIGKVNWRDGRRRAFGFILVVILLETYSSTQQIVALSTTESEYISTKDVAHALEIRSVLAECGMTLKMTGKTDATAERGTAAKSVSSVACITWMRDYRGCSGCGQKA